MPSKRQNPFSHPLAVPAPLPAALKPQLATLAKAPPSSGEGVETELKFDGFRLLARVGADIRLYTKNGNDWTARLPHLRAALAAKNLPEGWYDGEMVVHDEGGRPSFSRLQASINPRHEHEIVYYVFDCVYASGYDLRDVPLRTRRELLRSMLGVEQLGRVRFSVGIPGKPEDILAAACAIGLEGIMVKRCDSRYVSRRSNAWIKLKCGYRERFRVCGFTGQREGPIRSLILGRLGADGSLHYCGKVQGGLTGPQRQEIGRALRLILADTCPFAKIPLTTRIRWVEPRIEVEVAYAEMTEKGILRHPVFKAILGVI